MHIPQHSMILLDREFDVDENYWSGIDKNIELHIRQKDTGRIRLSGRKKGKQTFDRKKYGMRKFVEIYSGIYSCGYLSLVTGRLMPLFYAKRVISGF